MVPEIKIVSYVVFVISLFVLDNIKAYVAIFAVLCLFLARLPARKLKSGWLPISLFVVFTFLGNVINQYGKILFSVGPFIITREGLNIAATRSLRLILMIAGVKILLASTRTEDIVSALGRLLSPLEKLGLPMKDFFYTMGLTIKCFPVLKNTASDAYRERMKKKHIKGFRDRIRFISMFLLPMFIKSMQSPESFFEKKETDEEKT